MSDTPQEHSNTCTCGNTKGRYYKSCDSCFNRSVKDEYMFKRRRELKQQRELYKTMTDSAMDQLAGDVWGVK